MVAAQPGHVCLIPVAYGSSTAWLCVLDPSSIIMVAAQFGHVCLIPVASQWWSKGVQRVGSHNNNIHKPLCFIWNRVHVFWLAEVLYYTDNCKSPVAMKT